MQIFSLILSIIAFIIIVLTRVSKVADDRAKHLLDNTQNQYINKVRTYFFTKDSFDFEKFCDYIMCIRDDQSINDYAEMLIELDLMIKLADGLKDRMIAILVYDSRILSVSDEGFLEMQKGLREGIPEDTFSNLVQILLVTLFYLKRKTLRNI